MSERRLKKLITWSLGGIILFILAYNLWAYQGTLLYPVLKNADTDTPHKPLAQILREKGMGTYIPGVWLGITKSRHELTLYAGKTPLKIYRIALDRHINEMKQKAADGRTPLGHYVISEKKTFNPPKRFTGAWMLVLNYPNYDDAYNGLRKGLITGKDFLAIEKAAQEGVSPPQDTPLGGNVSIHGGYGPLMGDSWTDSSVGMYSKDIEEIFDYIPVGTRVVIAK